MNHLYSFANKNDNNNKEPDVEWGVTFDTGSNTTHKEKISCSDGKISYDTAKKTYSYPILEAYKEYKQLKKSDADILQVCEGPSEDHISRLFQIGFIGAVLQAYNKHYELILKPDDVWMAILVQLSFYVNKYAEDLRHKFVSHDGQKTLTIHTNPINLDFGEFTKKFTHMIADYYAETFNKAVEAWGFLEKYDKGEK